MRDTWPQALQLILEKEGRFNSMNGWVNDPSDSGGPTKAGLTYNEFCAFTGRPQCNDGNWDQDVVDRLRAVDDEFLSRYYRKRKWDAIRGDDLPLGIDLMAVDCATLFGIRQASLFVQRAAKVQDTGHLTDGDILALRMSDAHAVLASIAEQRHSFCEDLAHRRPKDQKFLSGWHNRTRDMLVQCSRVVTKHDQDRMRDLGYQVGTPDGDYGPLTRSAYANFQMENGLHVSGARDEPTSRLLHSDGAKPFLVSESRANITADELLNRGSEDVSDARASKQCGRFLSGTTLFGIVDHIFGGGVIDGIISAMDKASSLLGRLGLGDPSSAKKLALFVFAFGVAAVVWQRADRREARRVEKARSGKDISR